MKCEGPPPATPAGYFLVARDLDTSPLESLTVFFTAQGRPLLKDQDWHAYDAHHTLQARLPAPPLLSRSPAAAQQSVNQVRLPTTASVSVNEV